MERTSSLDLFRGSDVFSDLSFLEGQEALFEPSSSQTPVVPQQSSQAVSASLPVTSTHLASGQRPSSRLLHSSQLAAVPASSSWPQAASTAFTSSSQPASLRHNFLSYDGSTSQRPASAAESQADSVAALLADDTALGFADDCFRRESDLFIPQERTNAVVVASDHLTDLHGHAAVLDTPAAGTGLHQSGVAGTVSSEQPAANTAPSQFAAATAVRALLPTAAPVVSPANQPSAAQAISEPTTAKLHSAGMQDPLSVPGAAPPSVTTHSALKQPAAKDPLAVDAHPGACTPARAEESLETQDHTAQASEDKSTAELASTAPPELDLAEAASPGGSPKSIQSPPSPSLHQHTAPAQHVVSPSSPQNIIHTAAPKSNAEPVGRPEQAQCVTQMPSSATTSHAAEGAAAQADVQPADAPHDSLNQPVNGQMQADRPQLSVQEYCLPGPEGRNDDCAQRANAQTGSADVASGRVQPARHASDHSGFMEGPVPVVTPSTQTSHPVTAPGKLPACVVRMWSESSGSSAGHDAQDTVTSHLPQCFVSQICIAHLYCAET